MTGSGKLGKQLHDQRRQHAGEQQASSASKREEHERFGQQLPDDARAGRTDRGAHSDLPAANCGTRQENARDIRARNDKDDGDDRHQNDEKRRGGAA